MLDLNLILGGHPLVWVSMCLVTLGFIGIIESREFVSILVNIELLMLGVNFYLITFGLLWGSYEAQVMALCLIALTAAETVVGLGLLIVLYRNNVSVLFSHKQSLVSR